MREIKFRAYCYKSKKFITDFCLESNGLIYNPGIIGYRNDLYLNQYTGLKDKNGKEIYEGDICKYYNDIWWEKEEIFEIKYTIIKNCGCTDDSGIGFNFYTHEKELEYIEIIGNIYESPELLENNQ